MFAGIAAAIVVLGTKEHRIAGLSAAKHSGDEQDGAAVLAGGRGWNNG